MFAFFSAKSLTTALFFLIAVGAMALPCWSDAPTHASAAETGSDSEAVGLGVAIADSPGVGVLVVHVASGSPAQAAGIVSGDFVLSVDGQPIEVPRDLITKIRSTGPDRDVKLGLWRGGKELTVAAKLAHSEEPSDRGRAWLGVALDGAFRPLESETEGAIIAQVIPGSPAEKAKLQVGDSVVAMGDRPIKSAEQLIEVISGMKPGEVVHLTVNRDGMETAYKIELGSLDSAPPSFSSQRFPFDFIPQPLRTPEGNLMPPIPFGHVMRGEGVEDLKEQMDEFRTQLKEMREQLRTLRRGDAGQSDDDSQGGGNRDDQGNADGRDSGSQSSEARRPTVVDHLPAVYRDDYLAAPPYYGPYGYPQGFNLPRYNPYGFYGAPPYSSGFNVPWYSYPFNSPHVYNFFEQRPLPYYYQRGGHYYYSRRPYYDQYRRRNQVAPTPSRHYQ